MGRRISAAIAAAVVLPFVADRSAEPFGRRSARRSTAVGSIFQRSLPGTVVPPPRPVSRDRPAAARAARISAASGRRTAPRVTRPRDLSGHRPKRGYSPVAAPIAFDQRCPASPSRLLRQRPIRERDPERARRRRCALRGPRRRRTAQGSLRLLPARRRRGPRGGRPLARAHLAREQRLGHVRLLRGRRCSRAAVRRRRAEAWPS